MNTFKAKRRGSLLIEGVSVPFEKGMNVSPLSEQIGPKVLQDLVNDGIWADVTVEIKEAEVKMSEQLKAVENARKARKKK